MHKLTDNDEIRLMLAWYIAGDDYFCHRGVVNCAIFTLQVHCAKSSDSAADRFPVAGHAHLIFGTLDHLCEFVVANGTTAAFFSNDDLQTVRSRRTSRRCWPTATRSSKQQQPTSPSCGKQMDAFRQI